MTESPETISLELTQDQAALLVPILQQLAQNAATPQKNLPSTMLTRRALSPVGSPLSSPSGPSSIGSPLSPSFASSSVTSEGSEVESSCSYSSVDLFKKKAKNTKSTEAQNYLHVSYKYCSFLMQFF